ncbi:MAG: response regulator [Candidatus Sulfotelmatobacter sp.]
MSGQILIVDDNEAVRNSLRLLLSSRSEWKICGEAVDGLDAICKARVLRPDIVLMDISMPRMDGLEATRVLRKEVPEAKVVIVSQNDPAVVHQQAQQVDAAAYVVKSDILRNLFQTLEAVVGRNLPKDARGMPKRNPADPGWLAGGGTLGRLIRERDWSLTSLGPIESWPQSLKTSVNLILSSQHPMWIGWGKDATFLYNDAYLHVLSLAKHPWALGRPASEVWAEIWDVCGPLADKVFEKGEASFVDDVRLFMNRGDLLEETYYSFSYSPILDETGNVAGLFCPSTEVTPKVINARRLRTLSDLSASALTQKTTEDACASALAALANNPDDIPFAVLYLVDEEGENARLAAVCGLPKGVAPWAPPTIRLNRDNSEQFLWPVAQVLRRSESVAVDLKNVEGLPLGPAQQKMAEAVVLPVTTRGADQPLGILIVGVNPTRRLDDEYRTFYDLISGQMATAIQNVRLAEEERNRLEALAEIDQAKTAFFSNVSHEFRTPLTLMLGPVEDLLAKSHTDLPPAAKAQLQLVNRNGNRLLRLVNTLLDFSRIEAGRMQAVYQPTDLAGFTVELASVFRSATEKAGLRLVLDCPKLSEAVFVDRNMWEKIVLNLISNAFKFTLEGEIAVSLVRAGNNVELRVRDTGVGIPAHELPRVFDRFHRIENTRSRTHEGSGIGLALVLELVKLHGGTVRVESVAGKGSTFIVSLPHGSAHLPTEHVGGTRTLATTAVGAAPFVEEALRWLPDAEREETTEILPSDELIPIPCPPSAGGDDGSEKRPRILVADDNADMRQYLIRLLAERYEVEAVPDGEAALASSRKRTPDVVLSDVMMPNLDGFGLLEALRADPNMRTVPIILLSARAGEESRVEGMEHGADDYLIKPFSARELLARVQTHLEMARVRKQAEDALRQRTAQFETLLNEAPLGVYVVDSDFRIREVNPTAFAVYDNLPDLVGRDFEELTRSRWRKEYADEIVNQFRHTLETGKPFFAPERIEQRRDNGECKCIEWQINRIPLPDGRYGVVCYFRDISRMVRARRLIAESEERLRLAQKVGHSGTWELQFETGRLIWSPELQDLWGVAPGTEAPGEQVQFRRMIYPEDLDRIDKSLAQTIETRSPEFNVEFRITRTDGVARWIESISRVFYDDAGKPLRIIGVSTDITPRKQAEESARKQRERFDLVAEASQVGFWFCDLPFDKLIWDHKVKEHFWLPSDAEVTIDTFYERLHPEDRDRTHQAISESIENDTPYNIEYRTVAPDGRQKWIRAMGRTFYKSSGQPIRFDGLTLDITERKRIEERERKMATEAVAATAKFRAVFEQTPVFAGIMALDGTLLDANRLSLKACGYSAEEVLGRRFWDTGWWRLSEETQAKIRAATAQAAQGTAYEAVLTYHWADGTERVVNFALHPIRDHEGKILFLHPTGVDITDLKRAEENYRTLAETLEAEVRARTRELEYRNADVVRQSEQLRDLSVRLLRVQDEERRRIARELHDSAGQILAALSMNLSRVAQHARQDGFRLTKEAEDSEQLVQQLNQEIRTMSYLLHPPLLDETGLSEALRWYIQGLMERNSLQIELSVAEDFGRLSREMELVMFRLVQECLTNIHRHSDSKSAIIRIAREDEIVSLEVKDQGKGISPERLAEIQAKGSGVGITGMRERVRQFGGHMNIDSNHKGTTISFTLPLAKSVPSKPTSAIQPVSVA